MTEISQGNLVAGDMAGDIGKGLPKLGLLLRELGLTREHVAEELDVSKHALANWCRGQSSPSLAHLGSALQLLGQSPARPERLRDILLDGIVSQGLDEGVADAYLGMRRLPRRNNAYVILLHHVGLESQMLAARMMHSELLQAGREPIIVDCCGMPHLRKLYFEEVIPLIAPAGLILCSSASAVDLDAIAASLARLGIPTVYLGERPKVLPSNGLAIALNDHDLGQSAGQRVAELGCEKVAVISYEGSRSHAARVSGFDHAMAKLAPWIEVCHMLVPRPRNNLDIRLDIPAMDAISQFLLAQQPQAVFVPSLSPALALAEVVSSFAPGDHLSLTAVTIARGGWDTLQLQCSLDPRFEIIDVPTEVLARKAVRAVLRLNGEIGTNSNDDPVDADPRLVAFGAA